MPSTQGEKRNVANQRLKTKEVNSTKVSSWAIARIGMLVLLILILRPLAYAYIDKYSPLGLEPSQVFPLAVGAIGIITFFGFAWVTNETGGQYALHKEGMRLAIVASVIVVDLVLVTTAPFLQNQSDPGDIFASLVNQFNTIVGVVVAFYFGASAYVQVGEKQDKSNEEKEAKD